MNFLAKLLILGAVTMCGGTMGYLQQAGFFAAFLAVGSDSGSTDDGQLDELGSPMSQAEYRQRTQRGWWIGGVAGAGVGLLLVAKLSSNRD